MFTPRCDTEEKYYGAKYKVEQIDTIKIGIKDYSLVLIWISLKCLAFYIVGILEDLEVRHFTNKWAKRMIEILLPTSKS